MAAKRSCRTGTSRGEHYLPTNRQKVVAQFRRGNRGSRRAKQPLVPPRLSAISAPCTNAGRVQKRRGRVKGPGEPAQPLSAPCASMASKVTPSTPGAPSFCLAISYAARRVSILQTWTYRPQKRQDGSAFALTYIGGVANGRAPSLHGHYPASSLLRAQPPPSRLRPTSRCRRLYGLPCSGDFAPGRGGLLQLLGMSLSPCCRFHPPR